MHKRIVFLDVDFTLNTKSYTDLMGRMDVMDPKNVLPLKRVIEACEVKIVVSSNWRKAEGWRNYVETALSEAGWSSPPIVGRTYDFYDQRGKEIDYWLAEHPTEAYLIIDDIVDNLFEKQHGHIIEVNPQTGFTEKNAFQIMERWGDRQIPYRINAGATRG